MKYMIIRIDDERSSDICKAIEAKAIEEGGLEFPFTIGKYRYDHDTLEHAFKNANNYYTNTFHVNCRSTVVPISEEAGLVYPGKQLDDLDKVMLTEGALAESATIKMAASGEVSDDALRSFSNSRMMSKMKNLWQFVGRKIQVTYDFIINRIRSWL